MGLEGLLRMDWLCNPAFSLIFHPHPSPLPSSERGLKVPTLSPLGLLEAHDAGGGVAEDVGPFGVGEEVAVELVLV